MMGCFKYKKCRDLDNFLPYFVWFHILYIFLKTGLNRLTGPVLRGVNYLNKAYSIVVKYSS